MSRSLLYGQLSRRIVPAHATALRFLTQPSLQMYLSFTAGVISRVGFSIVGFRFVDCLRFTLGISFGTGVIVVLVTILFVC